MLRKSHPNILTNIEGEALEAKEGNATLLNAFPLALLTMYALMAIPFRSYVQPLIVMSVIPFGLVGAVMGHWVFGEPLSQLSTYGIVALAGIVVNDSLVLVDYINRRRKGRYAALGCRTGCRSSKISPNSAHVTDHICGTNSHTSRN